ncbi:MAG: FtsX-like permease family protein [Candidatus Lokiarchaeota archaeon]|nr:FtsX-like permease family protein [Candidatus Lokiarchaeota archaeon]
MMSMRSRKRFIVFTLMYTALMIWMSYSLEQEAAAGISFWIAVLSSVVLSVLYAWILINQEKLGLATLKCIGYTNNDIRTIIIGEIIWVTTVAFLIVAEMLIHYSAVIIYFPFLGITDPFIKAGNIGLTIGLFTGAQVLGILLAYSRVLKLRPIVALRVMK